MAQKERIFKKLSQMIETGEKIYTDNMIIPWKGQKWEIEFITKHTDGRCLACFPNPMKTKGNKPYRAFYLDDLPTLEAVKVAKEIIQLIETAIQTAEDHA